MTPPRPVPSWDEFYIGLAYQYAAKSKDPNTQCGAVVVDKNHIPLGIGFNGPPKDMNDNEIDWGYPTPENPDGGKYPYIVHAEKNAIRHSRVISLDGFRECTLYVTGHPCKDCMLDIALAGIKHIIWAQMPTMKLVNERHRKIGIDIAQRSNIKVEAFTGSIIWVRDRVAWMQEKGLFDK